MTSRERLLNAIRCRPVDRVPINTYELCARNSQSFENNQPSYQGLMQFIREHTDAVAMWNPAGNGVFALSCLLYTSPSPRDRTRSRMPSSA